MDTGTHIAMGVALGSLATLDPTINQDPSLYTIIFTGTILGSHAPDFDTIFKFKNNAAYIRFHRGFSHSIPMIFFWSFAISILLYVIAAKVPFWTLTFWTTIAVCLHIIVDLFNAYGTQALRPFSRKWIAFGFINTFDPYLFFLHIGGIVAWLIGAHPGYTWLTVYLVVVLYYTKRYLDKREIVKGIMKHFPEAKNIVTSPTIKQNEWRIAFSTKKHFHVGMVVNGHIQIIDRFENTPLPDTLLFHQAKEDKNIAAFLNFSPLYCWEIVEFDDYTEVRLIDLRYRYQNYYPFVAIAHINKDHEIINSYTGWVFSEYKLRNKLRVRDSSI